MTRPLNIIILAQGKQTRLPGFKTPKHLLELPMHAACGADNFRIVQRTVAQLARLVASTDLTIQEAAAQWDRHTVTIINDWPAHFHLQDADARLRCMSMPDRRHISEHNWLVVCPRQVRLQDPGNSSLLGFERYIMEHGGIPHTHRTVVLLGDVVYSWRCLERLLDERSPVTFAITPILTADAGEVFGFAWNVDLKDHKLDGGSAIQLAYAAALRASSKADETVYQSGQLRHLVWQYLELGAKHKPQVTDVALIDDYTMDVDLPEHLVTLASASIEAYGEDKERGLI